MHSLWLLNAHLFLMFRLRPLRKGLPNGEHSHEAGQAKLQGGLRHVLALHISMSAKGLEPIREKLCFQGWLLLGGHRTENGRTRASANEESLLWLSAQGRKALSSRTGLSGSMNYSCKLLPLWIFNECRLVRWKVSGFLLKQSFGRMAVDASAVKLLNTCGEGLYYPFARASTEGQAPVP